MAQKHSWLETAKDGLKSLCQPTTQTLFCCMSVQADSALELIQSDNVVKSENSIEICCQPDMLVDTEKTEVCIKAYSEETSSCSELSNNTHMQKISAEPFLEPFSNEHAHPPLQEDDTVLQCPEAEQLDMISSEQRQEQEETQKMLAEDVASFGLAEFRPSNQQEVVCEDVERVIVNAILTCKDSNGVDTVLNHYSLSLHLSEREVDAALRFLEEENELKPHMVKRYLDPLTEWLHNRVEEVPTFPEGGHQLWGDLEEMVRAAGPATRTRAYSRSIASPYVQKSIGENHAVAPTEKLTNSVDPAQVSPHRSNSPPLRGVHSTTCHHESPQLPLCANKAGTAPYFASCATEITTPEPKKLIDEHHLNISPRSTKFDNRATLPKVEQCLRPSAKQLRQSLANRGGVRRRSSSVR